MDTKELNPLERQLLMLKARKRFRIALKNHIVKHIPSSTTESSDLSLEDLVK